MTERTPFRLDLNERGIYEIRWSEKTANGTWRSREKSTKAKDLRAAEAVLARFVQTPGADRRDVLLMSVDEVLEEYLVQWSAPRGNEATDIKLTAPLSRGLGSKRACEVDQAVVDHYIKLRRLGRFGRVVNGKPAKERPASDATIRRELVLLQAALNRALRDRDMPALRLSKPSDSEGRILWLTEAQEEALIRALPSASDSVQAYFRLGTTYGARSRAMLDLRFIPEQLDFARNHLNFHVPGARITRKRRTQGPMTPEVREVLARLVAGRRHGEHVLDRTVVADFLAWVAAAGFGWVTPHVLKHTAITLMLRGGVQPMDVAAATATDLRTIMRVYRHYTEDELMAAFTARRRQ